MRRALVLSTLVALGMAACLTVSAAAPPVDAVPPGTKPFGVPLTLRYAPPATFSYSWRSSISAPGHASVFLEGWIMRGRAEAKGDRLEWSYKLSNIGRDGVAREVGEIAAATDPWGKVLAAQVLSPRADRGLSRLFDADLLAFPLCCCPRGPVSLGAEIEPVAEAMTMPNSTAVPPKESGITALSRHSVAAGIVEQAGHRYLVVRHSGNASAVIEGHRAKATFAGYTMLDTATCLPARSVWTNTIEGEGFQASITHQNGVTE